MNKVKSDIWSNSYPIFIWLVTEPVVGLIDSKIAGLIGETSLSGVGIGETIYFVLVWVFVFLAYGTTPLVAKLKTQEKFSSLKYFVNYGKKMSLLLGLFGTLFIFIFSENLIGTFKPSMEVGEDANTYLWLRSIGITFYLINMHSTAVLRGLRYPKITLRSAVLVSVLNIFFSYLFAIIFNYGIAGIGLASTISFIFTSMYSSFVQREKLKRLGNSADIVDKNYLRKKFFSVGSQILLRSMFLTGFMTVLRNQASLLSMKDIALQHVLLQLWSFGYVAIDSIAIASQTLISEHISKGIKYYKSELYSSLIQIAAFFSLILMLVSYFFLDKLITFFAGESFSQLSSSQLKFLFSISLLFGSFAFLWDGVLLGLDKVYEFSLITVLSSIVGIFLAIYLINTDPSLISLWRALVISLVIRGLLGFLYQRSD
ncbi:MATE family efflux transporter [Candidatus Actinomarina]|jgi:putative MATE family efflux protein|nr:MATE family efflux transporter [Candidatus Actinomarina sp.]|tara:strand:- start:15023 stop:16306 length:1284 start_codon:yes stop_codon:yes gene_type:complete